MKMSNISRKKKCMELLPYISGLFQRRLINTEEKSEMARMCYDGIVKGFDDLYERTTEVYRRTSSREARIMLNLMAGKEST